MIDMDTPIKEMGLYKAYIRKRYSREEVPVEDVVRMRKARMTWEQIEEFVGIDRDLLRGAVKAAGYDLDELRFPMPKGYTPNRLV